MKKKETASAGHSRTKLKELTMIGLMAAVICIVAPFSIPLPFSPVPISLTNFAIYITIYVIGMRAGAVSYLVYLFLGAVGLPVFSSFSGGLGKLLGPTGGYLIGFLFIALIQGLFMKLRPGSNFAAVAGMIIGTIVCYTFGTAWLAFQASLSLKAALTAGVIPYLPGDAVKIILSSVIGPKLARSISRI